MISSELTKQFSLKIKNKKEDTDYFSIFFFVSFLVFLVDIIFYYETIKIQITKEDNNMSMEKEIVSVLKPKYYMSEEEFYKKAHDYLAKIFPKENIPEDKNSVQSYFHKLSNDIKFWTDNSQKQLLAEEIIILAIAKRLFNADCVAFTYMCHESYLDEELIESLMYITSGMFSFKGWTRYAEKYIVDKLDLGERFNLYTIFNEDLENGSVNDRELCRKMEIEIEKADNSHTTKIQNLQKNISISLNEIEISESKLENDPELKEAERTALTKQISSLKSKVEQMQKSIAEAVPTICIRDQLDWVNIAKYQAVSLNKDFYEKHKNLIKSSLMASSSSSSDE